MADPDFNSALLHHQSGRLQQAEILYRKILDANPHQPEVIHLLGVLKCQLGDNASGINLISSAIVLQPNFPVALSNLGSAFIGEKRYEEAINAFQQAIAMEPDCVDAHYNLGVAYRESGKPEKAIDAFNQAIMRQPEFPQALNNLGMSYQQVGKIADADAAFRKAILYQPDNPEALTNLANLLSQQGRSNEALLASKRAVELAPNIPELHSNLAMVLKDTGRLDEAIQSFETALSFKPDHPGVHSGLIYTIHFHPDYDLAAIAKEHSRWNIRHAEPLKKYIRLHSNVRDPDRRLKIGYVSPDFFMQAESHFTLPLLSAHDHQKFEIHCYSSTVNPDQITAKLRQHADQWHEVSRLDDAQLAEKIRADEIDILVDLTMHMRNNRLLLFARKPAPIQVTWLAYPGGTGLTAIDYRISDIYMDPANELTNLHTEKTLRLSPCWCCYDPLTNSIPVTDLPASSNGYLTFGSFNNFCKLNRKVINCWGAILKKIEKSRLILLAGFGEPREDVLNMFASTGITPDRIDFVPIENRETYLRYYNQIDIALDPFPYNGITTTCDAIWMGVPVLSVPGSSPQSRAGLSLLSTVGLHDWIACSMDDLPELAATKCGDIPSLAALRMILRNQLETSVLMNPSHFAQEMETAFRQIWQTWCRGE